MIVILNAKFALLFAAHANKKYGENRRSPSTQCCVLLVEKHWRLTFLAVFTVRPKTSLLYIFQRSIQANRNINLWQEKRPFSGYPAVKHPKHSKFAITGIREKPVNFSCCSTWAPTLVFAITLLTQVPVQKFPFLFISIIPCTNLLIFRSCDSIRSMVKLQPLIGSNKLVTSLIPHKTVSSSPLKWVQNYSKLVVYCSK